MADRRHPALTAGLALWFGLTVVGQKLWRPESPTRSRWQPLHLVLPDWRFFAPDPGVYDQVVLYRTGSGSGPPSGWTAVREPEPRRVRHAVWNPQQRVDKALWDVCAELTRFIDLRRRADVEASVIVRDLQLSVPYLTLLSIVSDRASPSSPGCVQFMIALSGGWDPEPPEVAFVSDWHPLGAGGSAGRAEQQPSTQRPGHSSGR